MAPGVRVRARGRGDDRARRRLLASGAAAGPGGQVGQGRPSQYPLRQQYGQAVSRLVQLFGRVRAVLAGRHVLSQVGVDAVAAPAERDVEEPAVPAALVVGSEFAMRFETVLTQ
ncbi:hypothetical protein C6Y14_42470 [Streptomyces dioscori]|uniref:Uncharacterized protein n=1 Tax=Streptomyces dioscori TaxID=2109333 RepID=A0A2P8PTP6_9ACTN|nr:hypothetical protein C6Y14_42470 [Streptomyces dioscori]